MQTLKIVDSVVFRRATRSEIPTIRAMQERSLTELGADFYSPAEIAGLIDSVGTMDDAVIDEGHYFVAVDPVGAVRASGGWSLREPGYDRARIAGAADRPAVAGATVRSVFVDPAIARCGVASALMAYLERDAGNHGIRGMRLTATLSGLAFYTRLGWRTEGKKVIALPGGLRFGCVSMSKRMAAADLATARRAG
jgi:GNAT superfamily N-acetyltransferase